MKKWLALPIVFVPILFIAWQYLKKEPDTAVVETKEIKKFVYASGYVEPENIVFVKAEVSGLVERVLVKEGDPVGKNQPLAVLSSKELDASLKDLQARLRLLEERLQENSPYLNALKDRIQASYLQMEQAKREYERRKELAEKGLVPREQLEKLKNAYEVYLREYQANLNQYEDALSSLKAEKKSTLARIENLKAQKEKYIIKSPVDGIVLSSYVKEGAYINHLSQENILFSVGDPKRLEVVLEVDEEYAGFVKEGQKVYLTLDAFPGKSFEGEVYSKDGQVDKTKKTIKVKVKVSLPENTPAYTTVDGKILLEERKAVVVPKEAIKDGKALKYERVRLVEVPVKVGSEYEGYFEVLEGLKPGDRVVLR